MWEEGTSEELGGGTGGDDLRRDIWKRKEKASQIWSTARKCVSVSVETEGRLAKRLRHLGKRWRKVTRKVAFRHNRHALRARVVLLESMQFSA
ncbi:hypothetical protein M422DRAFT_252728 [Sphaerobolus stellatus SS14]|uniref:Uncharacterized protein n=1 Tax=Sphaerobolus stellatus (strain SS14) TaxID=990650 RepID=A0A0C9VZ38_SPHS4|nr:hypothetical protein M422DRAFT_252728 [Sphaerobolus stellatus SS14]